MTRQLKSTTLGWRIFPLSMILVRCFCPSTAPGPMTQPGLWQLPWIKACCTWGVTNWRTSHTTAQTSMTQSREEWEKFSFRVYRYGVWLLNVFKATYVVQIRFKSITQTGFIYTAVSWHSWSEIVLKSKFVIPFYFKPTFLHDREHTATIARTFLSRIFFVANKKQK